MQGKETLSYCSPCYTREGDCIIRFPMLYKGRLTLQYHLIGLFISRACTRRRTTTDVILTDFILRTKSCVKPDKTSITTPSRYASFTLPYLPRRFSGQSVRLVIQRARV
uniref:Uncharacterized protein n=1 Tax=Cacopsylla melanoneura TaxID=428564 RepID=A0A8D8TW50_9HEMI